MKRTTAISALTAAVTLAMIAGAGTSMAGPHDKRLGTDAAPAATASQSFDRFIVRFEDGADVRQIERALNAAAATAFPAQRQMSRGAPAPAGLSVSHVRRGGLGFDVVRTSRALNEVEAEAFMRTVRADASVSIIEPDVMMQRQFEPDDEFYGAQWALSEPTGGINMPNAWERSTGEGIVVAVIDTGYVNHADLSDNLVSVGYDFIADPDVSRKPAGRSADAFDPGDWHGGECNFFGIPEPSSWHGTHVAGTIAALTNNGIGVASVAPDARILPVRVLGKCGGYLSDIADAITWSAGGSVPGVPDNEHPAEVINMSLGGSGACDAVYQTAIDYAVAQGTTVVVAGGNSNADSAGFRPSSCNNVIAVAASNRAGQKWGGSNFGDLIDVTAPGAVVLSTLNSGLTTPEGDDYGSYSGTSMAAPHVAATVALMQAAADTPYSPADIEDMLKATARPLPEPDSCPGGCGAGIIDANAAVAVAQGEDAPPPPDYPPPAPPVELENGVPVPGLAAEAGEELSFVFSVPEEATSLEISISGGSGDADLYVRQGAQVYEGVWDCRPWDIGNDETCSFSSPEAGEWYIKLIAYETFEDVTLVATYSDDPPPAPVELENGVAVTDLAAPAQEQRQFWIEVPEGATDLEFAMSGGTGDADLHVRFGEWPTTTVYDCRPYRVGNNEVCTYPEPEAGTYYVMINAYSAFSGVTLVASFEEGVVDPEVPSSIQANLVLELSSRALYAIEWAGGGERVDILRNGRRATTIDNTGRYAIALPKRAGTSYTYQVCNAGTDECSGTVEISFD